MKKGFTLIELLIVIVIIIIVSGVSFLSLQGGKTNNDLTDTTKQIGAMLREAQSDSMAQEQDAAWGVYFSNATSTAPFYALFQNSYSTSTAQARYRLPSTVSYAGTFLASGAVTSITFSSISGAASASMTIQLYVPSQPSFSSTITVASSGAVSD